MTKSSRNALRSATISSTKKITNLVALATQVESFEKKLSEERMGTIIIMVLSPIVMKVKAQRKEVKEDRLQNGD